MKVSVSENMTSKAYSIASMEAFTVYAQNQGRDVKAYVRRLDKYNYGMMNIVDYLVGNTDRHWGNWGVLVDNSNNRPVCLHKLMEILISPFMRMIGWKGPTARLGLESI